MVNWTIIAQLTDETIYNFISNIKRFPKSDSIGLFVCSFEMYWKNVNGTDITDQSSERVRSSALHCFN